MRPAGEGDARAGPDDPHFTEIFAGTLINAAELNRASSQSKCAMTLSRAPELWPNC